MKTNFIYFPKPSLNYIFGFLSIFIIMTSCGSYQNSSYYDTDGIYSTTDSRIQRRVLPNESATAYQNYFSSLQDNNDSTAIFTDVDKYSNYNYQANQQNSPNYTSWGSNSQDVTINYYPNNWEFPFGYGYPYFGFGWANSFYGFGWNSPYNYWNSYYGWGYPYFRYGYNYMNNPYFNGGFYSHDHFYTRRNFSYNSSRRGSYYPNSINSSSNYVGRTSTQSMNNYPSRNSYNRVSTAPTFSRNTTSPTQNQNFLYNNYGRTRNYNTDNSNQNYNPTRSYNPNRTNDSYTPARSYNPSRSNSDYSPSRSSDSNFGRSSGGGGSYGSGGGGGRRGGGR